MHLPRPLFALIALVAACTAATASAQQGDLPYWASLADDAVNMRRGPNTSYPIEWAYARRGLPVRVVRLYQGWRLVEDPDGHRGWILGRLLSRTRTAIVIGEGLAPMRAEPAAMAALKWNVEAGVSGQLGDCTGGWCELEVRGHRGWVEQARLWGAGEP